MSRCRGVVVTFALVASLGAGTIRVGATEERYPPEQQESIEETFLGFRPGEEIRYTLERADGERSGLRTTWSMWLEEFDREAGVFALTYEVGSFGRSAGSRQPQGGTLMIRTTATARINAYGFPTRVRFTTQRNTPMGGLEYTIEYHYENRRFIKELEADDEDQEAKLEGYRVIDLDAPAGMYLFMPIDAECVSAARQARGNRGGGGRGGGGGGGGGGGMGGGGGGRSNMDQPCQGREPVFANLGLLNLTIPALWEAGTGQLELLAMAPTGVLANALMGGGNRAVAGAAASASAASTCSVAAD